MYIKHYPKSDIFRHTNKNKHVLTALKFRVHSETRNNNNRYLLPNK